MLVVIRSLLFNAYFWLVSVAMTVGFSPALVIGNRLALRDAQRHWAALVLWGLRVIARTDIAVRGREHIPKGGALVAAKHQSIWDTIVFHLVLSDPAMVMKRELLAVPLYGRYARATKMIIIDRKGQMRSVRQMVTEAKARMAEGRQIVIFPEGTRKAPGAAPDYKPGVAALYTQLGVPCIPVALNSGVFWPRRGFLRRPGTITIAFLDPIRPGLPRPAFMAALRDRIENATDALVAEVSDSATPPSPVPPRPTPVGDDAMTDEAAPVHGRASEC